MRFQLESCFESRPVSPVFAGSSAPQNRESGRCRFPATHPLERGGGHARAKGLVTVIG